MARPFTFAALVIATLALAAPAWAGGGNYVFDGGTPRQQAAVRSALDASSFDWSLVPQQIVIHIERGVVSEATAGRIDLDADLLDMGEFAWGTVQHEYAHQVDFFLLDAATRARLAPALGGVSWWDEGPTPIAHSQLTAERFASTLAWSYWQVRANALRPTRPTDEAAAMAPAAFRALLATTLTNVSMVAAPRAR